MDNEFCYLLGMMAAGAEIGEDSIIINFPLGSWVRKQDSHMLSLYQDSIEKITPLIKEYLNVQVEPRLSRKEEGRARSFSLYIQELPRAFVNLLEQIGFAFPFGKLRERNRLLGINNFLENEKIHFLKGFADVLGSCAKGERRKHGPSIQQVVTFDIPQENFFMAMDLCHIFYSLGIGVDDIKWGHPNLQVTKCMRNGGRYIVVKNGKEICTDPNWKKGHKVRARVVDYASIGFGLELKKDLLNKIFDPDQTAAHLCPNRKYLIKTDKMKHQDEDHESLPPSLHKHIIHFTHVCLSLGCTYAPKELLLDKLNNLNEE